MAVSRARRPAASARPPEAQDATKAERLDFVYDVSAAREKHAARGARSKAIHDEIRNRICMLKYPPGTVLGEVELAKEFGVSRTPIRQVLQRLALAGLVEVRNGVGTIVTSIELPDLRDIYDVRLKIAEMIGELSPRHVTAAELAAVEALRQRAERLAEAQNIEEYWTINHEMHLIISGLIGNSVLRAMWDQLYFLVARLYYGVVRDTWAEVAPDLLQEIAEVQRALEEDDLRAVGYIQRNHIASGMRRVMERHAGS
ncbi:MAG: GntR family transcriptional regulator [Rhodospirillales bacterium]|nr:GntR family transcriptional regulator [Rhodospirillales bacterium]